MPLEETAAVSGIKPSRKEKRKALKKLRRKQARTEAAIREREVEESCLNDPEEQLLLRLREHEEAEKAERGRREFEEQERLWLEAAAARKSREEEDERRKKLLEEEDRKAKEHAYGLEDDDQCEYADEGPAEIIWQGNEIIVKKRRVKVAKRIAEQIPDKEDDDRPTSNPLLPQSAAFASHVQGETVQEMIDSVAQQVPNFGTEQDKAHCPFHLKTGVCRFGSRCSRVHFYPDKSCTLLIKNMHNGPGLTCEQDEGLEYTDEEVEHSYEEFYEDVHTEFLKFGEIVNFKVCKNSSFHLRGNLYVHYKSLESALLAFNAMNARYYAGRQISCDFVSVTRWKVAICGEYMKSRLKTCSHGSACNFIHCFRNPGGEYEWADWDNPPPRYWIKRMIFLFGTPAESGYAKEWESEDYKRHSEPKRTRRPKSYSYDAGEEDKSREVGDDLAMKRRRYAANMAEHDRRHERRHEVEDRPSSIRRKRKVCSEEQDNSESKSHKRKVCSEEQDNSESKSLKKHNKKQQVRAQSRTSNWDSFGKHSLGSKDQFNEKYSSEDLDSDEDYGAARYRYSGRSGERRRKYDRHSSRQRRSHRSHELLYIAGKVGEGEGSDESPGRWKVSQEDFLVE